MTSRTRFLITTAILCHHLLAPRLVTSQLLSLGARSQAAPAPKTSSSLGEDQATFKANAQERVGPVYKLHRNAEIHYGTYILRGDEMTYNEDTGDATVEGHAMLDGGPHDAHLEASRGTYNFNTEIGRFEYATGSIGARVRGTRLLLTSPKRNLWLGCGDVSMLRVRSQSGT